MKISYFLSISKILTDLCAIRQKIRIKNTFEDILYNFLVVKKSCKNIKKLFLKINGKRSVKLRSGSIKFKNHFKQLAVPFKIDTDFESVLKAVLSNERNNNTRYTEEYQEYIPCAFAYKVVCVDDEFSKDVVLYRGKNTIMLVEDERSFKSSNKCRICNKLFVTGGNKVRNQDHVTGKYRGSVHWSCNINLKLTKKIPVIFHNLKGYDSHLIMQEIGKFDKK